MSVSGEADVQDLVLDMFQKTGALLQGHFILTSGLHSPVFLQKNLVFQYPERSEILCRLLAEKLKATLPPQAIEAVLSPAVGGIIPGYETARYLQSRAVYCERENGCFALRRAFDLQPGQNIVIIEDIISTGGSVQEVLTLAEKLQLNILAVGCIVDRSGGKANFGDIPLISLAQIEVPVYHANELPESLQKIPARKPGSRDLEHKSR